MPIESRYPLTLSQVSAYAILAFLEQGTLPPTAIAQDPHLTLEIEIEDMPSTQQERIYRLFEVGYEVGEQQSLTAVERVYLITRAWLMWVDLDDPDLDLGQRLADLPDRREVLLIAGLQVVELLAELAILEIVREAGQPVTLRPREGHPLLDLSQVPLLDAFVAGFQAGQDTVKP
ncbi:MAG: hypothetical protein H6673_10015 [Anaerolineales bacterium]|nr:hypothetical protein [Anaerolineales bacterium]